MGGQGSGRKPNPENILKQQRPPEIPIGDGIYIPNYSGLQDVKKTDPDVTSAGHTIQDEGTNETQRTNLNFSGSGVSVDDDSVNDATIINIAGGGGGGGSDGGSHWTSGSGYIWPITTTLNISGSGFFTSDGTVSGSKLFSTGRIDGDSIFSGANAVSITGHNHSTSDITTGTFVNARISEASVTQHEGAIDHDALTNFVANEHIDWTNTTSNINAGTISGSSFFSGSVALSTSDTIGDLVLNYPAGSFDYPASNPAPLDNDSGTNEHMKRHLFDDTTEEFVHGNFQVPSDIDTSGTVTFEVVGYANTAASGVNVEFRFGHSAKADGESWDASFTNEDSGDISLNSTQDQLDIHTWTETVSNLGWAANDHVRFRLSRIAPTGTDLTGDYGLVNFRVIIPRT